MADRREHALDLVLAAFVHRQLDAVRAEAARAGGRGRAVVELDAVAEPLERLVGRLALDLGLVDLLDLVARMGEPVRELAVVREQERAGGIGVEPADRDDAGGCSTRSTTVRRPSGSCAVVTTPAGLCRST